MKNTREILNPVHKVGIKILSDIQMKNVFPSYPDVINRIEAHRKWLEKNRIESLQQYQYNLMYDNVISIFGKRGTGKTSVAFTLHKKLKDDVKHPYDIVLPIIIPEVIPADGSALGWLLAIVKDQVLEFEKRLEKQLEKSDTVRGAELFWSNCKFNKTESRLSEELERLVELFHSAKYNPANELSYNIAVGNSVKQAQNYYEFAKAIVAFWDHWVAAIRELYKMENNTRREIVPLIYFVFDDVDLAPQKVAELLSIIIKYLSHPNIIVITTADEEMFLEVIEERLDHDIGRLPKEWRVYLKSSDNRYHIEDTKDLVQNNDSGELVRKTAIRYLGKVMPTSTRYYLKLFNTVEEKQRFNLDEGKGLWNGICAQVDRLLKYSVNNKNFLTEGNVDRDYYLNFLGNTSRQLGNAYIGIKDFIDFLIQQIQKYPQNKSQQHYNLKQYIEEIYNGTWRFLHISIKANHDLAEQIDDVENFVNEAFWLEHNEWYLYINYAYLDEYLKKHITIHSKTEYIKTAFQLFSLFHFTEYIFVILEGCTEKGITGRKKIHGISYLREFLCDQVFHGRQMFRRDMEPSDFLAHYKMVLNRIERLMEDSLREKMLSREYFYDFSGLTETVSEDFLTQAFRKDGEWLQEISGMLSAVYGNLYLIGKRELKNCIIYENQETLSRYQMVIKDLLDENIYTVLDEFNLLNVAQGKLKENFSISIEKKNDTEFTALVSRCMQSFLKLYQEESEKINDNELSNPEDAEDSNNENRDSRMIEPVFRMIEMVIRELKDKDIAYLLNLLPSEEGKDIAKQLNHGQNASGMLAILKMLYNSISEWDYTVKNIFFNDIAKVSNLTSVYGARTEYMKESIELIDYINQYIPPEYEEHEFGWYFVGGGLYGDVKERLNRIRYAAKKEEIWSEEKREEIEIQLEEINAEIDAAFNLNNDNEFREAVLLGLKAVLATQIQRLYLYYSVVEHYDQDKIYASKKISNENSFYNELFLRMAGLLEKDVESLSKEEKMVRSLIRRAALQNRKEYIRSTLQEAKNESFQN